MTRRSTLVAIAALLSLIVAIGLLPAATRSPPVAAAADASIELRPLQTSADRQIMDDTGRQMLLRGANVNSLGQYWQGVPGLAPTLAVTDADWDTMAAHGFSVIRLIVTWSRVEPTRGNIDEAYLDEVETYVDAAAAHGIYTVIDMHQDAYTDEIATTDPSTCPAGTTPAKGWDGAPAWATITDGLSTCLTAGDRNSSPAVTRAWNHFYDNTDGTRDALADAWGAVAARFAGRPEVAGYDLLNEPEVSRPAAELTPLYEAFIHDAVTAIRNAEHTAGAGFDHIVFVEPGIPAADLSRGIMIPDPTRIGLGTTNVVAAPHNYAESITDFLTIEAMSDLFDSVAEGMGVPVWIGEYGFWNTSPDTLAKVRRYAANEDAKIQGGAWWQWRQSCGDPHSVQWQSDSVISPDVVETHLNLLQCPDNTDLGPNDAFLDVLGRAYPRATPGRVTSLHSDPDTGEFSVVAHAEQSAVGQELVVWTPTPNDPDHHVTTQGLSGVHETVVPGGRIITARVDDIGDYALVISPAPPTSSTTTTTTTRPDPTSSTTTSPDSTTVPPNPPITTPSTSTTTPPGSTSTPATSTPTPSTPAPTTQHPSTTTTTGPPPTVGALTRPATPVAARPAYAG
ncbi:MAG TPA: cellulase family glycosylhydrolase [Acidimicrobiales bacterium]|nr:cellulase family glycosylhydrolase [Acidimicrobiales bacterium]